MISQTVAQAQMKILANYAQRTFVLVQPLFERNDSGYVLKQRIYVDDHFFYPDQAIIGSPLKEKLNDYNYLSEEKMVRAQCYGHTVSMASANKELQRYPGAVSWNSCVTGISGLAGLDDHCLNIGMRHRYGSFDLRIAFLLAGEDHEERLKKFLDKLPRL